MAKKTKTIAKIVEDAAVLLQKLVRLKAADDLGYCRCVTCGQVLPWNKGIQGGHFIDRRHKVTKIMEENIHPQCAYCNGPMANQGMVKGRYTIYMQEMYGNDFVVDMLNTKGQTKKFYKEEVFEIMEDFNAQIKAHEQRLGIQ